MRISDWSSDVCSSDLMIRLLDRLLLFLSLMCAGLSPAMATERAPLVLAAASLQESLTAAADAWAAKGHARPVLSFAGSSALARDRKSVVSGKSVSVRVDLGGRRSLKKKNKTDT